jgi:hypothetical protein
LVPHDSNYCTVSNKGLTVMKNSNTMNQWPNSQTYSNKKLPDKCFFSVTIDSLHSGDKSGYAVGISDKLGLTYSNDYVIGMSGYKYKCGGFFFFLNQKKVYYNFLI